LNRSKWNIKTVEGKPMKFGTGTHICLPLSWLKKTVVVVPKEEWEALQRK